MSDVIKTLQKYMKALKEIFPEDDYIAAHIVTYAFERYCGISNIQDLEIITNFFFPFRLPGLQVYINSGDSRSVPKWSDEEQNKLVNLVQKDSKICSLVFSAYFPQNDSFIFKKSQFPNVDYLSFRNCSIDGGYSTDLVYFLNNRSSYSDGISISFAHETHPINLNFLSKLNDCIKINELYFLIQDDSQIKPVQNFLLHNPFVKKISFEIFEGHALEGILTFFEMFLIFLFNERSTISLESVRIIETFWYAEDLEDLLKFKEKCLNFINDTNLLNLMDSKLKHFIFDCWDSDAEPENEISRECGVILTANDCFEITDLNSHYILTQFRCNF